MSTFLTLVWLACTIWFIVSIVKFRRKTGQSRTILYSFLGGLLAFILLSVIAPSTSTGSQTARSSGGSSAAAGRAATTSSAEDDQFRQMAAALADMCKSDVVGSYPRYAKSEADVKVIVPGTIHGDQARAQVQAGGVKFNCLAAKGGQDTAKPMPADPVVAKRIAREDAAAAAQQQKDAEVAAAQQQKAEAAAAAQEARQQACSNIKLVIESWNWSNDDNFVKATGEVTNVSDESLASIEADVSIYTSDSTFIKNATGFLDYNPVLAGQTTPFTAISTGNPAMDNARLRFKEFAGGEIVSMDRKEYKNTCA